MAPPHKRGPASLPGEHAAECSRRSGCVHHQPEHSQATQQQADLIVAFGSKQATASG
jgi:hypothetical protein